MARYRLWKARTVPATALVLAFAGGVALAVPSTIWSGVGQREVVRVVRAGREPKVGPLTPTLRQSLRDIDRWARPRVASAQVDALLGAQAGAGATFAAGCGPAELVQALGRQLAAQRTVAGAHLTVDPFATTAFERIAQDTAAAAPCLEGALAHAGPSERVQLVRLMARLAATGAADSVKAALEREATRAVDGEGELASSPVYALHGFLAVERDLDAAGDVVRRTVEAQRDPAVQSALREVATRRFASLVPQAALL